MDTIKRLWYRLKYRRYYWYTVEHGIIWLCPDLPPDLSSRLVVHEHLQFIYQGEDIVALEIGDVRLKRRVKEG